MRNLVSPLIFLCVACTHPLSGKIGSDAAGARPDAVAGPDSSPEALADLASSHPDAADSSPDTIVQWDYGSLADAPDSGADLPEAAIFAQDGPSPDSPATETNNPWLDAHWSISGGCSDNPLDLMQALAIAMGRPHCSRTVMTGYYEGIIMFDATGRVTYITGDYEPTDPQGWVDSLAPYQWPCLASQTIAYGCA